MIVERMTRAHKILQDIYYSLYAPRFLDDLLPNLEFIVSDDVLHHCEAQWVDENAVVAFPSKSINVAVIYARMLEHHFGDAALDYLRDADLMFGLDYYFKPYPQYCETYDRMLELITWGTIAANQTASVKKTVQYFNEEFMIGSEEFKLLTRGK